MSDVPLWPDCLSEARRALLFPFGIVQPGHLRALLSRPESEARLAAVLALSAAELADIRAWLDAKGLPVGDPPPAGPIQRRFDDEGSSR